MATEFTVTLKSAAGDYASLNAAMAGVVAGAADLTSAAVKVFSISGHAGVLAVGDALTGLTSGATGTLVLVNAAGTQVLIKAITGTFQNGETVKKTTDATKTVTLSNAGDSAIIGILCFGMVDTTQVATAACTTNSTNYVRVYADATAVATMPYGTGYRLEITDSNPGINNAIKFIQFERVSLKGISIADVTAWKLYQDNVAASGGWQRFIRCYFKGVMHASNTAVTKAISASSSGDILCSNCVFEGWTTTGNTGNAVCTGFNAHTIYFQNCLVYNCANGFGRTGGTFTTTNCLYDHAGLGTHVGWTGTIGGNYNASSEATPPGANSRSTQTFTYVNTGTGDFHLASGDAGAKDFGSDLSADGTYPFAIDFDGNARPSGSAWDIGPSEYTPSGSSVNVVPGFGDLQLTGFTPLAGFNSITIPGLGQLTLTGFAPTIIVGGGVLVVPGVGSLSLTGQAPTPRLDLNSGPIITSISLAASTDHLDVAPEPGVGALSLTGFASHALANDVAFPGVGALTITGFAPNVLATVVVTPGSGLLTLTGAAPTFIGSIVMQPGTGALTLTGKAPLLSVSLFQAKRAGRGLAIGLQIGL